MNSISLNTKYRPITIDDCLISNKNKHIINNFIHNKTLNNLIIAAPDNYCKSTIVKCILRNYYAGVNNIKDYYININLLFGNKNIFNIVDTFKKTIIKNFNPDLKKIVIIEDLHNIPAKIQQQLVVLLASFSKDLIFLFTTNKIIDTIDNIQSFCNIIFIDKITKDYYSNYLKLIASKENLVISDDVINQLFLLTNGDIRMSLNQIDGLRRLSNVIDFNCFTSLYHIPNPVIINNIVDLCIKKDIKHLLLIANDLYYKNYSCNDILLSIINNLSIRESENDDIIHILDVVGKYVYINYKEVSDSLIQLQKCFISICK